MLSLNPLFFHAASHRSLARRSVASKHRVYECASIATNRNLASVDRSIRERNLYIHRLLHPLAQKPTIQPKSFIRGLPRKQEQKSPRLSRQWLTQKIESYLRRIKSKKGRDHVVSVTDELLLRSKTHVLTTRRIFILSGKSEIAHHERSNNDSPHCRFNYNNSLGCCVCVCVCAYLGT